jgi:SsrA-binding protein
MGKILTTPVNRKVVALNRRAKFDFAIVDTFEAGIMLMGSEVKSLRLGKASINEAYAGDNQGELFLFNAFIPEYIEANRFNHEPKRPRKLLVHKKEWNKMLGAIKRQGMTLVPMSIYFNEHGRAKVELALAKGKTHGDKRESIKERDWQRDKARILRDNNRGE